MIVETEALTEAPEEEAKTETDPQMEARAYWEELAMEYELALNPETPKGKEYLEVFKAHPKQRERFEQALADAKARLASGNFEAPVPGKQVSKREAYSEQASPEFRTGKDLFQAPAREAKPKPKRKSKPLPEELKGHPFYVWDGLLSGKHTGKMGKSSSVWTFLWCVEHTTSEEVNGLGEVLFGHAVKTKRIAKELGFSEKKVRRDLNTLESEGYIRTERTPEGQYIWVMKSKRLFPDKASKARADKYVRTHGTPSDKYVRTEGLDTPAKVLERQGNRQN